MINLSLYIFLACARAAWYNARTWDGLYPYRTLNGVRGGGGAIPLTSYY